MEEQPITVSLVIQPTIDIFQVHLVSALILTTTMVRVVSVSPVILVAPVVYLLLNALPVTHLNSVILGIQVPTVYVWTGTIILECRLAAVVIQLVINAQAIQ